MVKKTENTEEKIIAAASEVFLKKGMDGARMQEIADEAGINKSLLHYYFRSKDKLFDSVFTETFKNVIDLINEVFTSSSTLESFIENFVIGYSSILIEKPHIANFVLHELSRNPQRVVEHINSTNFDKLKLISLMTAEDETRVRQFNPIQIIVDILALCIFPFVAKPIIKGFMFDGDVEEYNIFIDQRSQHIIKFVKTAVFIQK
ncbi:MAG: TetR/AcrR family transcriptional regulator [Bacteroidetes bacterium]|nr:TetR/AcrR family transcriptional regulator [Bacteroidota bacterium]